MSHETRGIRDHDPFRYVVLGAGAVGSLVGAALRRAGERVALIGRPAHVAAIRRDGLQVGADAVDIDAFAQPGDVALEEQADVLLATKGFDAAPALDQALAAWGPRRITCLENGTRGEEAATARGLEAIGAVVAYPVRLLEPGRILPWSQGWIRLGGNAALADALRRGGLDATVVDDIGYEKRSKLTTNVIGALLAVTGLTGSQLHSNSKARALARRLVEEACAAFDAAGLTYRPLSIDWSVPPPQAVPLPDDETPRSSVWQDLHFGRGHTEVADRNGLIVRLGAAHGVPTPVNDAVTRACERMARQRLPPGAITVDELTP